MGRGVTADKCRFAYVRYTINKKDDKTKGQKNEASIEKEEKKKK